MVRIVKYGLFLLAIVLMVATVSAGTVEHSYTGNNVCKNPATDTFINFENGVDWGTFTNEYASSGVIFSTPTPNAAWTYGEFANWNYPQYWGNDKFWAGIADAQDLTILGTGVIGRLDFPNGANYVSVLVSGSSPVTMEAYDASGNLLDTAGPTENNLDTSTMDRLTVEATGISYVLIHDTGYFWVIDDVCIGATGNSPVPAPEFPTALLPATMIVGMLGAVFLIQRTREH